jgi:hypothetical protein
VLATRPISAPFVGPLVVMGDGGNGGRPCNDVRRWLDDCVPGLVLSEDIMSANSASRSSNEKASSMKLVLRVAVSSLLSLVESSRSSMMLSVSPADKPRVCRASLVCFMDTSMF